ncbi:MAG: hypothetical protein AAFX06_19525 [Planctomycetota bacterium]
MSDWRSRAKSLQPGDVSEANAPSSKPHPAGEQAQREPATPERQGEATEEGLVADVPAEWQPLDPATAFDAAAGKQQERDNLKKRGERQRVAWFEWLAFGTVAALVIAFVALQYRGRPKPDDSETLAVANATPNPVPTETTETAVESDVPVEARSFEARKQDAIESVLEDAGDGSFALGGPDTDMSSVPELPTMDASPEPAPRVEPAPPRRRTDFPKPLGPAKIVLIDRELFNQSPVAAPREELPLPTRTNSSFRFNRLYRDAFDQHQTYLAAKQSNADDASEQLAESILLFEQCLARPRSEVPAEQRLQIATTLAGLYRSAGRLFDAAVYATQVIRRADVESPLVTPSVTIAFSVLQESFQTQYIAPPSHHSLDQMAGLCELVEQRGIKHPQLDTMRFATAQFYEQEGLHDRAAINYLRVPESSKLRDKALLAAGRQLWSEANWREIQGHTQQIEAIVSTAESTLGEAIAGFAEEDRVTPTLLAGKVAFAQIALRREQPRSAVETLAGNSGVLANLDGGISMPSDFVTVVHELLFQAYSKSGDFSALESTLQELSKRYGEDGKDRITSLYKSLVGDFLRDLEQRSSVKPSDVDQLDSLLESALTPAASLEVLLWASETWTRLIDKASDPSVAGNCLSQADTLLQSALDTKGLDESERITLELRRVDLVETNGDLRSAYQLLASILRKRPAVLELQIRAADILSELATDTNSSQEFATAIDGREDDAVWGWLKLTNTLVLLHYDSENKTIYLDRLLRCGYELNRNRLRQADATNSLFEKTQLRKTVEKNTRQLLTTFAAESNDWKPKLESLQRLASQ